MKNQFRFLIICVLGGMTQGIAQTQTWEWAKKAGEMNDDRGIAISTDSMGNSYVTGYFNGTVTFGNYTITSNGYTDIFTAKYDSSGNVIWVQKGGGTDDDFGYAICIDRNGYVYVTGSYRGMAIFGNDTLLTSGIEDIFIARYDTSGNLMWVKKAGGTLADIGWAITADHFSNCYLTGYCYSGSVFGNDTVSSYGANDIFIAKYDSSGNEIWVKTGGGTNNDRGSGITTDLNGNCLITGNYLYEAYFENDTVTSHGYWDMFIAKYDPNGNLLWVRSGGGTAIDNGAAVIADETGNCYVAGYFSFTGIFDTITINSQSNEIFLAKYDSGGAIQWIKSAGGTGPDYSSGIARGTDKNFFLAGNFESSVATFGSNLVTNSGGGFDIFVAKFDSLGNFIWVKGGGGHNVDFVYSISSDRNGNCYTTGDFVDTTVFDATTLISNGQHDIIVAKLNTSEITNVPDIISSGNGVIVYPNPATTSLTVTGREKEEAVQFYDVAGRELLSLMIKAKSKTDVDVSRFPNMFFMKRQNGEVSKIVKE